MSKKQNRYIPDFKAKITLAALKNGETISKLDGRFGIHPSAEVDAQTQPLFLPPKNFS